MIAGLWISGGTSSSGVGIANASHIRASKDYNFDTISTEVIVLIFYREALIYLAFLYFESGISVRIKSINILPT